jgi:exodeoxyribonuclease VII small subunit
VDAVRNYARGAALKAHCERKLAEAEARIEQITLGAGGAPAAQPARFE